MFSAELLNTRSTATTIHHHWSNKYSFRNQNEMATTTKQWRTSRNYCQTQMEIIRAVERL